MVGISNAMWEWGEGWGSGGVGCVFLVSLMGNVVVVFLLFLWSQTFRGKRIRYQHHKIRVFPPEPAPTQDCGEVIPWLWRCETKSVTRSELQEMGSTPNCHNGATVCTFFFFFQNGFSLFLVFLISVSWLYLFLRFWRVLLYKSRFYFCA